MEHNVFRLSTVLLILAMLVVFLSFPYADCIARFTRFPPAVVNVSAGETVRFVWNYTVDHRRNEFQGNSPSWSYWIPGTQNEFTIGSDDKYSNWSFVINTYSCPSRYINPVVRVSRDLPATLVITNVTTADSGIYMCRLLIKAGNPISSSLQLFVADPLPSFRKVPASVLFVSEGDSVTLEWDYHIKNKSTTFALNSPLWTHYDPLNGWQPIGYDDGNAGWQWTISPACPTRLLRPLRVTKIYTASLVIFNVSRSDSGKYNCNLVMKNKSAITSQVELIVAATPSFTSQIPAVVKIPEGETLTVLCSATGPPTPNITWYRSLGSTKLMNSHGIGNSTLMIRNITKEHSGTYECQAQNNPNRAAVTRKMNVAVLYKPSFYNISDKRVTSIIGLHQRLICAVKGNPLPVVTWHNPKKRQIPSNVTLSQQWYSEILVRIKNNEDFGTYTCRATNTLGFSDHTITVIKIDKVINEQSTQDKKCYNQMIIICIVIIVVLLIFNIIMIAAACKRSIKQGETKMRERTNTKAESTDLHMANTSPFPVAMEITDSRQSTGDYDSVYEQPVDDTLDTGSPGQFDNDQHQIHEFLQDTAIHARVNQGSPYYQDLVRPHLTSPEGASSTPDYQPLHHDQTKPVTSENEDSKPYQPLQMKNISDSEYQELVL